MINEQIANSAFLASKFDMELLPLQFADTIADVGRTSVTKVVRAARVAASLTWRLLRRRPDAVYFTLSPVGASFYRDCLYVAILKAFRVTRIYHLHAKGVAKRINSPVRRALYRWAFKNAWIIHLSPMLAADLKGVVGGERMLFVANGVPDHADTLVQRETRRPGPPRVLYLSNMIEQKGPLVLLEALGALKARGVAFEATFAGASAGDGCLESFVSAVSRLELQRHVRYVGPTYGDRKSEMFRDHDLFALPTFYPAESFPLVLLEAMQWGLPVVSTREGAIPDIVEEGATGLLVRPEVGLMVAALTTLLGDHTRRERMGALARTRYLERFTLEHFERNLSEALMRCLS